MFVCVCVSVCGRLCVLYGFACAGVFVGVFLCVCGLRVFCACCVYLCACVVVRVCEG